MPVKAAAQTQTKLLTFRCHLDFCISLSGRPTRDPLPGSALGQHPPREGLSLAAPVRQDTLSFHRPVTPYSKAALQRPSACSASRGGPRPWSGQTFTDQRSQLRAESATNQRSGKPVAG